MERKTKVTAESGKQEIIVTREFDLPLELLFKAYVEPDILEQWMGTKVLKLDSRTHGSWRFETTDAEGNVVFRAHGTIHDVVPNVRITRTFEMEGAPFDVQLEVLEFAKLEKDRSQLTMQIVYRSIALRDRMLKLPFAHGLNAAHDRLQEVLQGRGERA